jgi:glutathione S-transferase
MERRDTRAVYQSSARLQRAGVRACGRAGVRQPASDAVESAPVFVAKQVGPITGPSLVSPDGPRTVRGTTAAVETCCAGAIDARVDRGELMLRLYFAPGSSSMAPHIALHEVGVAFDSHAISFARHEQRDPWFLALNPQGTVPLLLIDEHPLTEVAAIMFYLANRHPEAELWPVDLGAQAQAISWMSFLASTLHPARRRGLERARTVYGLAERRLRDAWCAGDRYSIADIHLFRLFWRFSHSAPLEPAEFPNVFAHRERVLARRAVRTTIEIEATIGYELRGFTPP